MQFKTFFTWLEGYYGKYDRPILRISVAEYVRAIPEPELEPLQEYLKKNFSTQYGFTPDIGTIEVARKDIKPIHKPYLPAPPDPEAKDMSLKVGQLMEVVLLKVSRNRREGAEKEAKENERI